MKKNDDVEIFEDKSQLNETEDSNETKNLIKTSNKDDEEIIENIEESIKIQEENFDPNEYTNENDEYAKTQEKDYTEKLSKKIMSDYEVDFDKLESLSDDEAIVELDKMTGKNDELIEKDYLSSLINQKDRMVYYEVENIYHDPNKKTFKNRFKLRRDPPILLVKDDLGNEAKFYLTENLTDELSETLRQVKRAYYGFHKPSDMYAPEKLQDKIRYYIKNNPFKILSTIFLILFLLSLLTK